MAQDPVRPKPWGAVALAALPGLLLALTRIRLPEWHPVWVVGAWVMVALYAILSPRAWRRQGRMPVWLLIPVGMLSWLGTYVLGRWLASLADPFSPLKAEWALTVLLNLLVAAAVLAVDRRARGLPIPVWSYLGAGLVGLLLAVMLLLPETMRAGRGELARLFGLLFIPAEALMLIVVGLLVARALGRQAVLVIMGGYAYILADSDYLWGFMIRDWAGLPIYLAVMTAIFLVLTPVAFLRARTTAGQAAGLFIPVLVFVVGRLVVPWVVLDGNLTIGSGDYLFSAIIPLSLLAGWFLYDKRRSTPAPAETLEPPVVSPTG